MSRFLGTIALLGTSADPPTYGHQALLKGLLKIFPKVITWASDNPMKKHGASLQSRHALLNALVNEIANPNLQLNQDLSSPRTIKTLDKASKIWPTNELVFVIGSDLVGQISSWENPKALMQKARIGIAPREGWPIQTEHLKSLKSLGGRVDLLPLQIPAAASSQVRLNPTTSQIPDTVLSMVLEQNLYGLRSKQ
ncbi:nicotinate-nucleotide adenylyltransferase [Prochlorococcus sp. MIT 1307]|uniref:nicotinate-nucleotide adenylyltransferase n=1 Tax=Prochlorococcus sp. MIT 1307 TaxID=3096219 RepID=UPI002A752D3B|nr:nicotinate-nucleotide adenylyltransferase [Prochlorococcus sp. MIT 1307]